ncbi:pregnancy-specific glycoprotein 22-like [Alexandromys fortis]|uniref:pregnancy-specific glycoprotein 22-like n=1 Tax=Alexandromys fortis TaxID=100897 RepID=UPI002152FAA0|nr:pregnancy-specific glycoprotein 22-like [Microtus fortis]
MEFSVLLCKRCTLWERLLLTASILTSWHLSSTANVTIELLPAPVAEGDNVLFQVHNLPDEIKAVAWFKGLGNKKQQIALYVLDKNLSKPGPMHSGRETIYHNGSLLLEKVTQKDAGFYTLRTYDRGGKFVSTITMYLYVQAFVWKCGRLATFGQPTIESVPRCVAEGGNVVLLVHNPPENILGFVWFKGRAKFKNIVATRLIQDMKATVWGPAYSGRETLHSDGSLLLNRVTQKDSGLYTLRILRTDARSEYTEVQLQVDTPHSQFCNPFASSQLMIQPVPRDAAEGKDVVLQVYNLPEDLKAFSWHRATYRAPTLNIVKYNRATNSISWGPEHRIRKTLYSNGSLILRDLTEKDAGIYTLIVLDKNFKIERLYGEFFIKKNVTQPIVQITDTTVSGGTSVIFTCISPDPDVSIRWIFNEKNLQLTERMNLSPTKCGLKIDPVRSEDAGEYKCEVSNQVSSKTSPPVSWGHHK